MDRLPQYPGSLCHECVHKKDVTTKHSSFLLCLAKPDKYPPQPVLQCADFSAALATY
jgi:hypothetical protein